MRPKYHSQSKCHLANPQVNNVQIPEEVFRISQVGAGSHAMITMGVGTQSTESQVTFQLDTGTECNLSSLKEYKRATRDTEMQHVKFCSHKFIKTYTNERYEILGFADIPTWRRGHATILQFNITEDDLAPLLSYQACMDLGLISINDSDDMFFPESRFHNPSP